MRIEFTVAGNLSFGGGPGGGALAEYSLGEGRLVIEPDGWAGTGTCSGFGTMDFEVSVTPEARLMGPNWTTNLYLCRLHD